MKPAIGQDLRQWVGHRYSRFELGAYDVARQFSKPPGSLLGLNRLP